MGVLNNKPNRKVAFRPFRWDNFDIFKEVSSASAKEFVKLLNISMFLRELKVDFAKFPWNWSHFWRIFSIFFVTQKFSCDQKYFNFWNVSLLQWKWRQYWIFRGRRTFESNRNIFRWRDRRWGSKTKSSFKATSSISRNKSKNSQFWINLEIEKRSKSQAQVCKWTFIRPFAWMPKFNKSNFFCNHFGWVRSRGCVGTSHWIALGNFGKKQL